MDYIGMIIVLLLIVANYYIRHVRKATDETRLASWLLFALLVVFVLWIIAITKR